MTLTVSFNSQDNGDISTTILSLEAAHLHFIMQSIKAVKQHTEQNDKPTKQHS